ncbi:MAG: phage holin family protein [Cytophagales bacterium]
MLIRLLVNALSVYLTAYLLSGVVIEDFLYAIGVAILLAIVNTVIRPILIILTIPITILTLGLFLFVINVFMIMLVDWIVDGFYVQNFWWALLFGIVMFFINVVLNSILGLEKE